MSIRITVLTNYSCRLFTLKDKKGDTMICKRMIFSIVVLFLGLGTAVAAGKFEPPAGKTMLVIGQQRESIDAYVDEFKTVPAGFMNYTDLAQVTGLNEPYDGGDGTKDGRHLVEAYPGTVIQLGLYMVDMLDGALAGEYDASIDRLGQWIADAKAPVYLRIGYECDAPHNHYDPQKYIQVYRRIVDRLRNNKVENVAFVWHSYTSYPIYMGKRVADFYPGDDYVDWFGVSFFDNSPSNINMMNVVAMAKEHGKPLMIAESTPARIGVQEGMQAFYRWYRPLFQFIEKHDVNMLCYINVDWDALPMFADFHWKDSRVQANKQIRKIWLDEISKGRYVSYSKDLFEQIGYTSPHILNEDGSREIRDVPN